MTLKETNILKTVRKKKKATCVCHILRRNFLLKQVIERKTEGRTEVTESEEEYVSSYWMALRKRQDTGNWKRKHCITFCGKLALERLWTCRKNTEWMSEWIRMIGEAKFQKICAVKTFTAEIEEKYMKRQSLQQISGELTVPGTSRTQSRTASHFSSTFYGEGTL